MVHLGILIACCYILCLLFFGCTRSYRTQSVTQSTKEIDNTQDDKLKHTEIFYGLSIILTICDFDAMLSEKIYSLVFSCCFLLLQVHIDSFELIVKWCGPVVR